LVTKSTPKSKKFNKRDLAKRLDTLSNNVAKRGVFVVRPNKYNEFDVFDYVNQRVYHDNFPSKSLAQQMCDRYNKNKKSVPTKSKRINELCKAISKHNQDCMHYMHIITTTNDDFKAEYTEIRLRESQMAMKHLLSDLQAAI